MMQIGLRELLEARIDASPAEFAAAVQRQEVAYKSAPFEPSFPVRRLPHNVFYLDKVDAQYRQHYRQMTGHS